VSKARNEIKIDLSAILDGYLLSVSKLQEDFEKDKITWEEEGLRLKMLEDKAIAAILGIQTPTHRLAIVRKKAELPEPRFKPIDPNSQEARLMEAVVLDMKTELLRAGFVQEEK
jgi:hypothetical protein